MEFKIVHYGRLGRLDAYKGGWGHDGKKTRNLQFKIRKTKQRTVKYMMVSFDEVRNSLVISFAEG